MHTSRKSLHTTRRTAGPANRCLDALQPWPLVVPPPPAKRPAPPRPTRRHSTPPRVLCVALLPPPHATSQGAASKRTRVLRQRPPGAALRPVHWRSGGAGRRPSGAGQEVRVPADSCGRARARARASAACAPRRAVIPAHFVFPPTSTPPPTSLSRPLWFSRCGVQGRGAGVCSAAEAAGAAGDQPHCCAKYARPKPPHSAPVPVCVHVSA
jgi:hypothetical protein